MMLDWTDERWQQEWDQLVLDYVRSIGEPPELIEDLGITIPEPCPHNHVTEMWSWGGGGLIRKDCADCGEALR